jgi:hypothetical protein|tara:strand:- start:143 stop:2551 length:2409 start_codon:yes stop_codon:yes gene_type:complete
MAERIVSPGVFTREKDLSFLPQGISEIGAALIGRTEEGPAFVPTQVRNFAEFEEIFGSENQNFYVPFTAKEYLRSAGTVTIVRVLGLGGYQNDFIALGLSGSFGGSTNQHQIAAVLKPSAGGLTLDLDGASSASFSVSSSWSSSTLKVTNGSGGFDTHSFSFNTGSAEYIDKVFSSDPLTTEKGVYLYKNYMDVQTMGGMDLNVSASIASGSTNSFLFDYKVATTPSIQSQLVGGSRTSLFKVNTRSHGDAQNSKFKLAIRDIREPADVAGSDYGDFAIELRRNNPGQNNDNEVLESFQNCNFDEDSVNYLPRKIGDRYVTIDSNGKLTTNGDYPNQSKFIYISDYTSLVGISKGLVPMGFGAVSSPHNSTLALDDRFKPSLDSLATIPSASFKGNFNEGQLNKSGNFDANVFYGFDFDRETNKQYLAPLPLSISNTTGNVTMSLENQLGHADASTLGTTFSDASEKITLALSHKDQRKFVVPFQGGFDGLNPAVTASVGSAITAANSQGFDFTTSLSSGSVAFKRAINAVSNPDEFDINLLVTPGIIHSIHPSVTNHAISKVEDRADCFYIMDGSVYGRSIDNAVADVKTLDSNYVATYYPWVKVIDEVKNKPTWVPPSVVLPGVYANTDRVAHEWFAPAGLNRGGLQNVTEAQTRLTHAERDELYENRINPIATFPGQGVVVFGQKTLQGKPSALDRINVRRLLIRLRKFIASTSRFLVFEQNNNATRNRFLNLVNPFLEQVQANSGLTAFRIVMDESNNGPDVVDRNQLVGQIFIQPTRTAEFIVLDFVVQPTGAAFAD